MERGVGAVVVVVAAALLGVVLPDTVGEVVDDLLRVALQHIRGGRGVDRLLTAVITQTSVLV
jgi:hypothetical protein